MTSMTRLMQSASSNWINGEPAPTREHLECRNPATGMLLTPLARGQASDVDAAVRAAQAAAPAWGARSFEDRAAILDRIADGIVSLASSKSDHSSNCFLSRGKSL